MQSVVITYKVLDDHGYVREYLDTLDRFDVDTLKLRTRWNKILSIANNPDDYSVMIDELHSFRHYLETEIMPYHAPKNHVFATRNGITAYWEEYE